MGAIGVALGNGRTVDRASGGFFALILAALTIIMMTFFFIDVLTSGSAKKICKRGLCARTFFGRRGSVRSR